MGNSELDTEKTNFHTQEDKLTNKITIPFWCRYTLSVQEAAQYFRIGETKLRKIINENPNAEYLLKNGSRTQIKRKMFEKFIDNLDSL